VEIVRRAVAVKPTSASGGGSNGRHPGSPRSGGGPGCSNEGGGAEALEPASLGPAVKKIGLEVACRPKTARRRNQERPQPACLLPLLVAVRIAGPSQSHPIRNCGFPFSPLYFVFRVFFAHPFCLWKNRFRFVFAGRR